MHVPSNLVLLQNVLHGLDSVEVENRCSWREIPKRLHDFAQKLVEKRRVRASHRQSKVVGFDTAATGIESENK